MTASGAWLLSFPRRQAAVKCSPDALEGAVMKRAIAWSWFVCLAMVAGPLSPARGGPPNVVFILADDLGRGDLGCYGQEKIKTPNIDRLAREGMRFTQFYAGSPVCAPSRCVLMTGKHTGHAAIRNNSEHQPEGQRPMAAGEVTLADLFKRQDYATAAVGKWGLGYPGSEADPLKRGFDFFYGFNCQRHAHNHYPTYIRKNNDRIPLEGNDGGPTGKQYSHDLMEAEALAWLRRHKDRPFFLYLPFIIAHAALQVPDDSLAEYRGKWDDPPYDGFTNGRRNYQPHPAPRAAYAAMVTRLDRTVGRVLDLLKALGLDDNTIVMFSSDNGPASRYGGHDSPFFRSAGPFRGFKGDVYEGGLRTPFIARWPGKISPGTESDLPGYFPDVLPTLLDLIGAADRVPRGIDGISIAPTLLGRPSEQKQHEFLVWYFPGYTGQHAVRMGDWKGVRRGLLKQKGPLELYNLKDDIGETTDVASKHPDVVKKLDDILTREYVPSPLFPIKALDGP
jgi:arylsulfatase